MKRTPITLFAALGLALAAPAVRAQAPDADIQNLLNQVGAAYRNMTAFSTSMEMTQSSGTKVTEKLLIKKPNMLAAEIHNGADTNHVVSDGTNVYSDSSRDKTKYIKQSAAKFDDVVAALARSRGTGVGLLTILLTSPSAEKQIIPGKPTSLKRLPEENTGSEVCDVIAAIIGEGEKAYKYQFAFGKQDHLLRKLTIGPAADGAKPIVTETYTDVTLTPAISQNTFKYTPAAGAVAAEPPKAPEYFDPRLKVGAEPFAVTGKDLQGKAVSLDQYKGKVLLIDFWATWCGPCVAELPNVIEAYNKYHGQGFEILGISLDQKDSLDKLNAFMADKKMTWRQIYDGKYWEADNAKAFGVRAIPFTLLIGKDGKIAAVGARGPALAPAIEAALKK